MLDQESVDELGSFLRDEFVEIPHPFDLSDSSRIHRFGNIDLIVDVFLRFLAHECNEERLRSVGDDFLAAFQDLNSAKYTDTTNRSRAVQDIALRFESFLKKVAYYRYPGQTIWHKGLDQLLKGPVLSLTGNLKQRGSSYWMAQPVMDAIIRDTYCFRHPSAHEAWKRSSAETERYARSVISAYLFVVAENLELLRTIVLPEPAQDFIVEYLQDLTKDTRFLVWEKAYVSLAVSSKDYADAELIPFDLLLSEQFTSGGSEGETETTDEFVGEERGYIEQIVGKYPHLVLIGEAGAGKTTTLQRLALGYAQEALLHLQAGTDYAIPVYVELNTYRDSLQDLIGTALRVDDTHHLSEYLKAGKFIFLLDGLNEVATHRYRDAVSDINSFMAEFQKNRYIITSRQEEYHNDLNVKVFEITPLTDAQIREYLTRYLGATKGEALWNQLESISLALGRRPLALLMLVRVFLQSDQRIPRNQAQLFNQFIEWMFAREAAKGPQTSRLIKSDVLVELGYKMQASGEVSVQERVARDTIISVLEGLGERTISPARLLVELVDNGFLTRVFPDKIRFFHQSAQEYFAALALQDLLEQDSGLISELIEAEEWDEVLVMLSGMMESADFIVTSLLSKNRLTTAARCYAVAQAISRETKRVLLDTLHSGIESRKLRTRLSAISALGEIRTQDAVGLFKEAILSGTGTRKKTRKRLRECLGRALEKHKFSLMEKMIEEVITEITAEDLAPREAGLQTGFVLLVVSRLTQVESGLLLLTALQSSNSQLADQAMSSICSSSREDLIPKLTELAQIGNQPVRERATQCLASLARLFPSLVQEALILLSQDYDQRVRGRAVSGLSYLDTPVAVRALLLACESGNDIVQRNVAQAMGSLSVDGLNATGLLDTVVQKLQNLLLGSFPDPTRRRAAHSLGRLGSETCISILQDAVLDHRRGVQTAALEGLLKSRSGNMIASQEVIDKLTELLNSTNHRVQRNAAWLLGRYKAYQAVPCLMNKLLTAPNARVRSAIGYSLKRLGVQTAYTHKASLGAATSEVAHLVLDEASDPETARQYARQLIEGRQYRAAREICKSIAGCTGLAEDYRHYARVLSIVGKEAEAEDNYRKAMRLDPEDSRIRQDFSFFLVKCARAEEAYEILKPLMDSVEAPNAFQSTSYATTLAATGRIAAAESMFRAAIQNYGDNPSVHNSFANFLKDQERFSEAEKHYLAAIKFAPESGVFANNYGMLLNQLGLSEEAEARFLKAIELDSPFPWPYLHLATMYTAEGEADKAVRFATQGIYRFLHYEDLINSSFLANLAFEGKRNCTIEHLLALEAGIVASALALVGASPENMINQTIETVRPDVVGKVRPLAGCLFEMVMKGATCPSKAISHSTLFSSEFEQVLTLMNREDISYTQLGEEILRIFSEPSTDWNLVLAQMMVGSIAFEK
jgi:HEAT repeat protein